MDVRDRLRDARTAAAARLSDNKTQLSLVLLSSVVGTVLLQTALTPPTSWRQWLGVTCGAVLAFAALVRIVVRGWTVAHPPRGRPADAGPRRWPWVLVSVLVVALVVGLAGPPVVRVVRGLSWGVLGCPPARQLRMLAEPETVMTARQIAAAYERDPAATAYGCPTVHIFVFPATAGTVAQYLGSADGWSDDSKALLQVGPRPDMWLAGTAHEVDVVRAQSDPSPVLDPVPVARSPLVLAVPGRVPPTEVGWNTLLQQYTRDGRSVARPDPNTSELGLLATALLYGDGSPPADPADPPPLRPPDVERLLDTAPDTENRQIADTAELLCRLRAAGPAAAGGSAVITSEQEVARFNAGLPLGGSCGDGPRPAPDRQLTALYPTDTADQDLQLAPLRWSDPRQRQAVADFGVWLGEEAGRDALVSAGLRPGTSSPPTPPLTQEFGVDPDGSPSSAPLTTERLNDTTATLATAQAPSHLLFLVDTSRAMAARSGDETRARVAADAARAGLRRLGSNDEFGLWFFPGDRPDHSEPVPLATRSPERLVDAAQELATVEPTGGRPLFGAMVEGVDALTTDVPSGVRALVVLTSGDDTTRSTLEETTTAVNGRKVRIEVVTLGGARCAGSGLTGIAAATRGRCTDADDATVQQTVSDVVDRLRGGG